jgi:hypothetical protein
VKKLTARSTRVGTLLVMLGLLAASLLAAAAQAVAATGTSTSDSLENRARAASAELVASRTENGAAQTHLPGQHSAPTRTLRHSL